MYHFHTRAKTGRPKELQNTCPEPQLEISEEDASKAGPFHFGYWDAPDDRARVANKLTQGSSDPQLPVKTLTSFPAQRDPVSKQLMFKSGVVKVEKCKNDAGEVKIHAKEGQTGAIESASHSKPDAHAITDDSPRERHLKQQLGATFESINVLLEIYDRIIPQLTSDVEVNSGILNIRSVTERMLSALEPHVKRYTQDTKYGHKISTIMRDSLFRLEMNADSAYETLLTIQSLFMYLTHVEGHLVALKMASQALWDHGFIEVVGFCGMQVGRMQAWAKEQLKVNSPQTLVVPVKPLEKEL